MSFIERRKITLGEALETSPPEIAQRLLAKYVEQLSREPLLTRVDILNQKYQPATFDSKSYCFDRKRLSQIDQHRHRIIHQLALSGTEEGHIADDLLYLEGTCFYFISILSNKHGISVDPMAAIFEALESNASSPVKLAYEALLLATSLPAPDEEVWSVGGQIFVRSANGVSRQLPLIMPAAQPNLSFDRRRVVFMKYRLATQENHVYGRRETLIGDLWISDADGSKPELALQGSSEAEGEAVHVVNPQFDPDGKLEYYLAHLGYATTAAICVLDLETKMVKEFTQGLSFVVLHGDPHKGHLLVLKHRYYEPSQFGSYDHFWLVSRQQKFWETTVKTSRQRL
jgi:hypothetical protein